MFYYHLQHWNGTARLKRERHLAPMVQRNTDTEDFFKESEDKDALNTLCNLTGLLERIEKSEGCSDTARFMQAVLGVLLPLGYEYSTCQALSVGSDASRVCERVWQQLASPLQGLAQGHILQRPKVKQEKEKAGRTVRFRVASANSGRVLTEVFKDETAWCGSHSDSVDSDCTSNPEAERDSSPPASEANSHLNGLLVGAAPDESGCEPDDLLLYASVKREMLFSNKRINICSKNGTIRGVRNKVSAGQVLFNNLSNMYSGTLRHQKRRPWEKE